MPTAQRTPRSRAVRNSNPRRTPRQHTVRPRNDEIVTLRERLERDHFGTILVPPSDDVELIEMLEQSGGADSDCDSDVEVEWRHSASSDNRDRSPIRIHNSSPVEDVFNIPLAQPSGRHSSPVPGVTTTPMTQTSVPTKSPPPQFQVSTPDRLSSTQISRSSTPSSQEFISTPSPESPSPLISTDLGFSPVEPEDHTIEFVQSALLLGLQIDTKSIRRSHLEHNLNLETSPLLGSIFSQIRANHSIYKILAKLSSSSEISVFTSRRPAEVFQETDDHRSLSAFLQSVGTLADVLNDKVSNIHIHPCPPSEELSEFCKKMELSNHLVYSLYIIEEDMASATTFSPSSKPAQSNNSASRAHEESVNTHGAGLYLRTAYPSHASLADILKGSRYRDAYKILLRVRIHSWILDDLPRDAPVNSDDVAVWLGIGAKKTFKNMVSRFNVAKSVMEWLKTNTPISNPDAFKLRILRVLVEGPLAPIPFETDKRDEGVDNDAIDAALTMTAKDLDRLSTSFKDRMRAKST